jgi:hypothetical protein
MLVQITVTIEDREARTLTEDLPESPQELEEATLRLARQAGRVALEHGLERAALRAQQPCCCGHAMRNCGFRPLTLASLCGELVVHRRRYRCQACGRECYPADPEMCCGRHRVTRPLAKRACQLATTEHYTRLPQLLADQHGVTLSHDTLVSLAQDAGGMLDRWRRAEAESAARRRHRPAAALSEPPARIYVSCDGIMYCTNQLEDDSQHPGEQRLIWQQMKVGCVYWQDADEHWHKRMIWGRESPEEFGAALWRLACQCGYEGAREKIYAADGGAWCWEIRTRYFSDAEGVLDWYHASEHVWEAARQVAAENIDEWAHAALTELHDGGGTALQTWLHDQWARTRGGRRTALAELLKYVGVRTHLMDYPRYRGQEWAIGTGMIEATCKQLVGVRLKGPGMHWSEAGAVAITALRATELNGDWHETWKTLLLAT